MIADKAFDADERVIEPLQQAGKTVVIPPRANRKSPRPYASELELLNQLGNHPTVNTFPAQYRKQDGIWIPKKDLDAIRSFRTCLKMRGSWGHEQFDSHYTARLTWTTILTRRVI